MNAPDKRPISLTQVTWLNPVGILDTAYEIAIPVDAALTNHVANALSEETFTNNANAHRDQPAFDCSRPDRPLGGGTKRLIDIVIAFTALTLAAPVMLLIALLIKMTAGGPAVFSHVRIGFAGKPFKCYKFRTMVRNADQALADFLAGNEAAAREWAESRKLRRDPRVTRLGRLLRKSSLDELPQLFNVLRGEMSCVGPRPVVADELLRYGACARDYLRARPGLTGLWQVTGRDRADYSHRVALDSGYVNNWSLWADFRILGRTVFAIMRFDRAS
jgi:exopolysaccharide production protein ExoY